MDTPNIIASCIIIVAFVCMIGLAVYKLRKKNKDITMEQFINMYYDNIIDVLQDVVSILQINIEDFDSKESYEKAIIYTTIDKLKGNCVDFGIDSRILSLFNEEALTNAIYGIFDEDKKKVFSVIGYEVVSSTPELYDESTIMKLRDEE